MRGALKVTYMDGKEEFYEVDPTSSPDLAQNLKAFLEAPNITLIFEHEVMVIPSTSVRHLTMSRTDGGIPEAELEAMPGVLVGVQRIVG